MLLKIPRRPDKTTAKDLLRGCPNGERPRHGSYKSVSVLYKKSQGGSVLTTIKRHIRLIQTHVLEFCIVHNSGMKTDGLQLVGIRMGGGMDDFGEVGGVLANGEFEGHDENKSLLFSSINIEQ